MQGQHSVSVLFCFPLFNFILIIKNLLITLNDFWQRGSLSQKDQLWAIRFMMSIKPEPDQSMAPLTDRVPASTRIPLQFTALDICFGLVFVVVLLFYFLIHV